ncbi:MAG: rod shape-determining protein MreC [Chloroflexota bacterium]|jgi:rod shape-determining protein MreC|nr:rod shape-determining protein MreC [Chloroflexota bacterium]
MRRGSQSRATSYFVFAVVLAVVLLGLGQLLRFDAVRGAAAVVYEPLQSGLSSAGRGARDFVGTIGSIGDTAAENRRLKAQVADLQRQLDQARTQQLTDQQLKDLLGLQDSLRFHSTAAEVIGFDPERLSQAMTINAGSNKGLKVGMSVLGQRGLVGRVVSVQGNSAQVRLVSDTNLPVNVESAQAHLGGTLKVREGRLVVEILGAPTDVHLDRGEVFVTSGLGGNFPKGLPVVSVSSFHYEPAQVAQVAEVSPLDDLARLEFVIVDTDFVPIG